MILLNTNNSVRLGLVLQMIILNTDTNVRLNLSVTNDNIVYELVQ